MKKKTLTLNGETITVTQHGDNDFDISFRNADFSVRGSMLDIIQAFGDWQMNDNLDNPSVCFDYDGIAICNPFYDETGRFDLDIISAVNEYGENNVLQFIMDACSLLRPDDNVKGE